PLKDRRRVRRVDVPEERLGIAERPDLRLEARRSRALLVHAEADPVGHVVVQSEPRVDHDLLLDAVDLAPQADPLEAAEGFDEDGMALAARHALVEIAAALPDVEADSLRLEVPELDRQEYLDVARRRAAERR